MAVHALYKDGTGSCVRVLRENVSRAAPLVDVGTLSTQPSGVIGRVRTNKGGVRHILRPPFTATSLEYLPYSVAWIVELLSVPCPLIGGLCQNVYIMITIMMTMITFSFVIMIILLMRMLILMMIIFEAAKRRL